MLLKIGEFLAIHPALDSKRQNRRVHRYPSYIHIFVAVQTGIRERNLGSEAGRRPAYLADFNSVVC